MGELLDSDRAQPKDARAAYILIAVCVVAVIAFAMFGHTSSGPNDSAGVKGGDTALKSGVEQATSTPELTVPK